MKALYITVWTFFFSIISSSTYKNIKDNVITLLKINDNINDNKNPIIMRHLAEQSGEIISNKDASILLKSPKDQERKNMNFADAHVATKNPRLQNKVDDQYLYRRQYKYKDLASRERSEREASTSREMREWKEEFELDRVNEKILAIKSRLNHTGSPAINIAAARPWSIPCGDPNQHDNPWGTCTLPQECDGDFRIFRGDDFCGNTDFVCCAVQLTQHDMYQGMDMSFEDSSFTTSSDEKRIRERGSKENLKRKKEHEVYRRRRRRYRLKRKLKKTIVRLVQYIRKSLNRAFRNTTNERRLAIRLLKRDIIELKHKFKLDRKVKKDMLDVDIDNIDNALMNKLSHVKDLNRHFLINETFRAAIIGNNMTMLRIMLKDYDSHDNSRRMGNLPAEKVLPAKSSKLTRRSGNRVVHKKKKRKIKDYLEYDIEYGALYY